MNGFMENKIYSVCMCCGHKVFIRKKGEEFTPGSQGEVGLRHCLLQGAPGSKSSQSIA